MLSLFMVPAFASPDSSVQDTIVSFEARLQGAEVGIGHGCVVEATPPHGAWTVVLKVSDPGTSSFAAGKVLCVVVHSPSQYQQAAVDADGVLKCRAVAGLEPPRFSCDRHRAPSANAPVVDDAWLKRVEASAAAERAEREAERVRVESERKVRNAMILTQVAAKVEQMEKLLADPCVAASPGAEDAVLLTELIAPVIADMDPNIAPDLVYFVDPALADLEVAHQKCSSSAPKPQ